MSIHLIRREHDASQAEAHARRQRMRLCGPVARTTRDAGLDDDLHTPGWLRSSERVLAVVGWVFGAFVIGTVLFL